MDEYKLVMGMTGWPSWVTITDDGNEEDFLNDVSTVFQWGAGWASQYFMQNR